MVRVKGNMCFRALECLMNSLLVGDGAKQWAQQNGISLVDNQQMKTGFGCFLSCSVLTRLNST